MPVLRRTCGALLDSTGEGLLAAVEEHLHAENTGVDPWTALGNALVAP